MYIWIIAGKYKHIHPGEKNIYSAVFLRHWVVFPSLCFTGKFGNIYNQKLLFTNHWPLETSFAFCSYTEFEINTFSGNESLEGLRECFRANCIGHWDKLLAAPKESHSVWFLL